MKRPSWNTTFVARVLERDPSAETSSLVERPRIQDAFSRRPWLGKNFVVTGPAGSGKTIGVLQAAINAHDTVVHVSARGVPEQLPVREVLDPVPGRGQIVAEMLNQISPARIRESLPNLKSLLNTISALPTGETPVLILDDLDLVDRVVWEHVVAGGFIPEQFDNDETTVFIMRRFADQPHGLISKMGTTRALTRERFSIQPEELATLAEHESFGTADLAEIQSAYQDMGGWFAGMQRMVNPVVMRESPLDDYVLDEIITPQTYGTQSLIFALTTFPYISKEIIENIEAIAELENKSDPGVLVFLPTRQASGSTLDDLGEVLPNALSASLDRLAILHGDWDTINTLRRVGISFFIEKEDYELARKMALASHMAEHYLIAMLDYCKSLARSEKWTQIRQLIDGVPLADLQKHSDYLFWLILAHGYDGLWSEFEKLHHLIEIPWSLSTDPLVRGRALLLKTWRAWRTSRANETLAFAAAAYDTLPADAFQERLIAAGTAEIAARQQGDRDETRKWSVASATTRANLPSGPQWWQSHSEFHRLSHMAMSGDVIAAQRLAEFALDHVDVDYPRARFRYLLLIAHIELERGNHESVRKALDLAESTIDGLESRQMHNLSLAQYWLALGEPDKARDLLGVHNNPVHNRPDRNVLRLRLIAQVQMMQGQWDVAEDILTNRTSGGSNWPKFFGDVQHEILTSIMHTLRGDVERAMQDTDRVIVESRRRGHSIYEVAALAVQAEIYHAKGDAVNRDRVIVRITELDPKQELLQSCMPLGRDVRQLVGTSVHNAAKVEKQLALQTLTAREFELLEAAAQGLSGRELADRFQLSQSTVRNHLSSAYKKLGVKSRREAILMTHPLRRKI